jgi:hypothetical protein
MAASLPGRSLQQVRRGKKRDREAVTGARIASIMRVFQGEGMATNPNINSKDICGACMEHAEKESV